MQISKSGVIGAAILGAVGLAGAHLKEGSLSIKGGESFSTGESVTLTWQVSTSHNYPIGIDISSDGGTTWKSIKSGLPDPTGSNTYKFNMSGDPTSHAIIRVCQTPSTVSCAAVNASQPSGPGGNHQAPYALVSGEFKVTGTSSINQTPSQVNLLGFDPNTNKVTTSFNLDRAEKVSLQVFDSQGRLQVTLFDDQLSAGVHKLSLEMPQNLAASPTLVFCLKIGEALRTQSYVRP